MTDTTKITSNPLFILPYLLPILLAGIIILSLFLSINNGPRIEIHFSNGEGIKVGNLILHKGIEIGQIHTVKLDNNKNTVMALAEISKEYPEFTQEGTRFWVKRLAINSSGIQGLNSLLGPLHIHAVPGQGHVQKTFYALDNEPLDIAFGENAFEFRIMAQRKGSISVGSPILFRQIEIGKIIEQNLSNDAQSVIMRALIYERFRPLIRGNSRFAHAASLRLEAGLSGFSLSSESLTTLLHGGIVLGNPDTDSKPANPGTLFSLTEENTANWHQWQPSINLRKKFNSPFYCKRVTQTWTSSVLGFTRSHRKSCWAIPSGNYLVAPNLLAIDADNIQIFIEDQNDDAAFTIAENQRSIHIESDFQSDIQEQNSSVQHSGDIYLIFGANEEPVLIAEQYLADVYIHNAALNPRWHGAAVFSADKKTFLGQFYIYENSAQIIPFNELVSEQ